MSSGGTPTLVVGLDGATFRWLEPLALGGTLPVLGTLLRQGARAPLRSTSPPLTPPGWATCLTGVSPARHGLWDFVRRASPQRYDLLPTSGHDVRAPWLWERWGAKTVERAWILNLPFSFPARAAPGLGAGGLVCGFDATDRKRATWPGGLLETLEQQLGSPYPFMYQAPVRHIQRLFPNVGLAVPQGEAPPDLARVEAAPHAQGARRAALEAVVQESCRFTQTKLQAARCLLNQAPFGFCFVHLFETDHLSHEAWDALTDPEHPDHPLLLRYLQTLDHHLGELIEAAGRYATPRVLLLSDHGFGACRRRFLLNDWLVQEGFLALKGGAARGRASRLARARWEDIDWSRTRAYAIQTGLYLNRKGTHPQGIVAPEEAPELLGELVGRLSLALDAEGGASDNPADGIGIQALHLGFGPQALRDLKGDTAPPGQAGDYGGNTGLNTGLSPGLSADLGSVVRLALAPDLIVHLDSDLCAMGYGELQGEVLAPAGGLEGYHRMDGICVACGPGIQPGLVLPRVEMVDIAPTILALLGVRDQQGLEGRVLWEFFQPGALGRPKMQGAVPLPSRSGGEEETLSASDEALLRERLVALGYLG